ncbi:DUF4189 domain-containing protein [Leeia sp. TBRC 13508]|uniref:DUF4189 domain-containing protein n=1 Tax=Leeia speluncae TaxID=2884804 RepID=A0ABS8D3Q8_9NEIS|nr:DUF4189 domain-containing protein [Leeia speluncae]MCB6182810.1 DUF4189 domain-containing protein [Leeia speluncae]
MRLRHFPLISSLSALSLLLPAIASAALCGDGYWDPDLRLCRGAGGRGIYTPGGNDSQVHTPRDYFGAIAADVVTGKQGGIAKDSPSASAAKQTALQQCGLSGCKVIIAYKNGCGSTAAARTPIGSPNHVVGGIGDSPEEAEENALNKCEQLNPDVECLTWVKASCSYYE